ncbi:heparinase II/III domain-containing protein [Sphingobacterium pedocola]|uniref:Heparinase n=1 Tax=Sphingobacterium pedocola TaxID=2082722 RepID=A0ABR9T1R3_9SPHI|nr:heparinase II/III family protein [Sphingobacterium pedocola]MBE8719282.1 heparinase [Sphingobacterium pedocola]
MKNFYLFICFVLPLTASMAYAKVLEGTPIAQHPRLLLLQGEEQLLWTSIQRDSYQRKIHQEILKECDRILTTKPVTRNKIGMRLLATSREAMLRIFYLSYAWRLTAEQKYVARAKEELRAISAFSDWNPSHFLDVAEMIIAAAIGYDWLYDELSEEDRALIKQAILRKGLEPSLDSQYNWWLKATHNWNQVCNAGMLFGALAIYEDHPQLASDVIKIGRESIKLPMKDYEPDGAYPEGYMYWGYGTTFNVLFISALERAFGEPYDLSAARGFLETPAFMQNMTGVTGDSFNFSDSDLGGVLQPAMFWFAKRTENPSLLWIEREHMIKLSANVREDNRLLPLTLIWSKGIDLESIEPPQNRIWTGNGKTPVALMRSSWTDSTAIYVGFKGGSPATNHGHMDVGSFVMEADGVRWAMDFGREDYRALEAKKINIWKFDQDSERWGVFKYTNYAHNTLTVNGELQHVGGYAPLTDVVESTDATKATIDLSSVYPKLAALSREITVVNAKYVSVKDIYNGGSEKNTIRWSMVTDAAVKLINNTTAELTKDGKQLLLKIEVPGHVVWKIEPIEGNDGKNTPVLVVFEVEVAPRQKGDIVVNLVPFCSLD